MNDYTQPLRIIVADDREYVERQIELYKQHDFKQTGEIIIEEATKGLDFEWLYIGRVDKIRKR